MSCDKAHNHNNVEHRSATLYSSMSINTIHLRCTYGRPVHPEGDSTVSTNPRHRVLLRHPGYDDANNILILLQASDHSDGAFHHETARIACAIIADNRWDGYFTTTRNGPRVDVPGNGLLPSGSYYFQVPKEHHLGKLLSKRWDHTTPIDTCCVP